ncbi:hypothetical protein TAL182_PC00416 (plasmid) [Rhizobium sp. TAL182]|nr:hypothetical protein TAL182_PC00416 [Rhizobium sp. TAL182]
MTEGYAAASMPGLKRRMAPQLPVWRKMVNLCDEGSCIKLAGITSVDAGPGIDMQNFSRI